MPVDRPNRDRAAAAIAAYLRGEIDNFKLDDETVGVKTDDPTLKRVSLAVWGLYDDIRRHRVRCSPEGWDFLVRCVAFLRTDLEWESPPLKKMTEAERASAPFGSAGDWAAHRSILDGDRLPPYDPAPYERAIREHEEAERRKRHLALVAAAALIIVAVVLAWRPAIMGSCEPRAATTSAVGGASR